jgi:hypothetical protein
MTPRLQYNGPGTTLRARLDDVAEVRLPKNDHLLQLYLAGIWEPKGVC